MRRNVFDVLNDIIRGTESSLVNLLSALAPWCAPLAPAYLSYWHMIQDLFFPLWVALGIAFVVEALGLSTISTAIAFWSHNRKYRSDMRRAPVIIPVLAFFSYLAVVLVLNVMIEVAKVGNTNWDIQIVRVIAYAMLTLLSIPAAVTLAVRTQHKQLIDSLIEEREERKLSRVQVETFPKLPKVTERSDWRNLSLPEQKQIAEMSTLQIVEKYGISDRTALNWRKWAQAKFGVRNVARNID